MATESSNAESVFFTALEKSTPEQRAAYLDQACGQDTKLRQRVEKLLSAQPNVGDFLEQPLSDPVARLDSPIHREQEGTRIGRYKLLQEIGEGGFGVVYMAEQQEPVRRLVALKIIKQGMDTREVIARFEAERQALAMMDHANIARVLDAGATEHGGPYFVMELVKGVPITEFCDKNNLETEKRLKLFMMVCRAVQHAHQKGIIHRDLKPSNIMITLHDGDPVPKVIDFGVAKAISQRLTEKTLFTRYGQMVGTPQYMSPEQAEMSGLDVDTRSDVYSLGVLLYELLTGTTPLESERLRSAAYSEMLRMIQEEEPAKPSTRLSTLGDSLTVVSEHRKTDGKRLRQMVRGDLDWIVMKALEKHRDRRYETANGLALDIQRHLNEEPVVAGPPGAIYRLSKMARRNKVAFAATVVVVTALVLGIASATWGLVRSELAEKEAIAQRDEAREAKAAAEEARLRAATRSEELARHVYLMQLANADRALGDNNYPRARRALDQCAEDQRGWEWRFLDRRFQAAITADLPSCEQPLFTSDGARLIAISGGYSSTDSKKAVIWDLTSERRLGELTHENKIQCVALSLDDKWVVGGDGDGRLFLWDVESRDKVWDVLGRKSDSIDRSGSFTTDSSRRVYEKYKDRFGGLAFSPDGALIGASTWDGHLRVFHTADGRLKFDLTLGGNARKLMFSPDGDWLAVEAARTVVVDTSSGNIVSEFPERTSVPTFSPDGQMIATGNAAEKRIHLWDWNGNELIHKKSWRAANSSRFADLRFCAGGAHLASVQGVHVAVWDVSSGKNLAYMDGDGMAWWLGVNPNDNSLGFGGSDYVRIWHYMGHQNSVTVQPQRQAVRLLKFSPDGKYIAMGSHRGQHGLSAAFEEVAGQVTIIDSETGQCVTTIQGHYRGFSWTGDSQSIVVTTDEQNTHAMYYAETGALVRRFRGNFAVARPYLDETGTLLTSIGDNFVVRTWDVDSGRGKSEFSLGHIWGSGDATAPIGGLWNAVVGPRGHYVAVAQGADVRLWDTRIEKELTPKLPNEGRATETLAFSQDGSHLYVVSGQDLFTLFDIETKTVIKQFTGPFGALVMSPDEKHVVSCGDGLVVSDAASGLPVITLNDAEDGEFVSVDWSPDNRRIAAGQSDGSVHIWTLPSGQ